MKSLVYDFQVIKVTKVTKNLYDLYDLYDRIIVLGDSKKQYNEVRKLL